MSVAAYWMIAIVGILQLKHFICDFPLQTNYMAQNKGAYGHPGGLYHAALHGIGSVPAALIAGVAALPAVLIIVVEMVVHYHLDWAKSRVGASMELTPRDHGFWIAFGLDQGLHHATYLAMAVLFFSFS